MTTEVDLTKVDFEAASRIKPAFAGLLVDWQIGAKEITSTIVDLTVRDFIFVSGDNISLLKNDGNLSNFERKILEEIFAEKKSLTFKELSKKAYGEKYNQILKIIGQGAMDEGIIDKDFQKKLAQSVKKALKETLPPDAMRRVPQAGGKASKMTVIPSWVAKAIFVLAIVIQIILAILSPVAPIFGALANIFFILIFLPVMFVAAVLFFVYRNLKKQNVGTKVEDMLTGKGKEQKKISLMLKEYMGKFPLVEDRLANELVSHSIAFGIGKQWMGMLGKDYQKIANFF